MRRLKQLGVCKKCGVHDEERHDSEFAHNFSMCQSVAVVLADVLINTTDRLRSFPTFGAGAPEQVINWVRFLSIATGWPQLPEVSKTRRLTSFG